MWWLGRCGSYDVFISHRGPDVKTCFVSHLHKALQKSGLRPFLDCNSIKKGANSWDIIEHAINVAEVYIPIFTKGFAQSSWCLRELHLMLKCPNKVILPIFFHVKPSDVCFPEKSQLKYGFEILRSREKEDVIKLWRQDLQRASKIYGFEYPNARWR